MRRGYVIAVAVLALLVAMVLAGCPKKPEPVPMGPPPEEMMNIDMQEPIEDEGAPAEEEVIEEGDEPIEEATEEAVEETVEDEAVEEVTDEAAEDVAIPAPEGE